MKVLFVVYDNGSYISNFPIGIGYLAAACRNKGHEVVIYNQDVYHYTDEQLTEFMDSQIFDLTCISACGGYYQYRKLQSICKAIRASKNKTCISLGGHLAAPEPEYFLRKFGCDIIGIGEGEITITEMLDALAGKMELKDVKGIAFIDEDGEYIKTPERPLVQNIDTIAQPAYDLFPINHYSLLRLPNIRKDERCMPILSGRGCTFNCNFCYRLDKGFRPRSAQSILEEIKYLIDNYNIRYFAFMDELLMNSIKRTKELSQSFLDSGLDFRWECNGRLNYAKPDVLELMKRSGCVFINYGIESMDDTALKNMNKALTVKQIIEGVENTLEAGISPGLNIIFGNIGEDEDCIKKDVEFLLKYDDHSQLRTIRPVTPYPGSPLYDYAVEKGLIKDCEDFYENKHTNSDLLTVNFTKLSDDDFYRVLFDANKILLDNYLKNIEATNMKTLTDLYHHKDSNFRGFRQS